MLLQLLLATPLLAPASLSPAGDAYEVLRPIVDPTLVSQGDLAGSWLSATLLDDGVISGVLRDSLGQPLFLLDAKLHAGGKVTGGLVPLVQSASPVLGFGSLGVLGQAQMAASGGGTFQAMIYAADLDVDPPFQVGSIDGVLQDGRADKSPSQAQSASGMGQAGHVLAGGSQVSLSAVQSGGSHGAAQFQPTRAGSGSSSGSGQGQIKPYRVRDVSQPDSQRFTAQKLSNYSQPQGGHQAGNVIVCPKGPDVAIGKVVKGTNQSASNAGSFSEPRNGSQLGGAIVCPKAPDATLGGMSSAGAYGAAQQQKSSSSTGVQAAESYSNAGHTLPAPGNGKLTGRWVLFF